MTLLSTVDKGVADQTLINTVKTTLNAEDVRPLTDSARSHSV
ncbi:hypothetical protein [Actinobacillus porcinus]|nr:hypothetical protein [Actinobacillus porcinus]